MSSTKRGVYCLEADWWGSPANHASVRPVLELLRQPGVAALANGAAPITLIDGDKLIDLLIEHSIGVKKRAIEVLAVDPDAFSDLVPDDA